MLRNIVKDFVKPKRVELDVTDAELERYGKFVAEPLERGYGTTIGNSLRRIMLSSLPGAAITSVRMEGVKHEFSTIDGCVEDVTEIILNLKEVVLTLAEKETTSLRLDVDGPCQVTAGMLSADVGVTVVNPSLHICTLNEEGKLRMELDARVGRGYATAELNKGEEYPVGTIFLDSVFSPVRKVNHYVTNARLGQRTDFDKLTIEVWTDGSIAADSAVRGAAYILRDQLSVFAGSEEVPVEEEKVEVEERPKLNENLFRRIDELELSVRSSNCLENADIKYIGELVQRSEVEMLRTKNFGRKSLNEIKDILSEMSLSLDMHIEGFPAREALDQMTENSGGVLSD